MPIRTEDVKIQASQRLTDNTDGGGYMTGREIVDGAINNLFTDISRLDRTYGRVSLRKFYLHVDTEDTEMYSGAHMIISELAKDPNVNVALFSTENEADTRLNAVNRLESYVTLGPRTTWWLWEDQPAGARQLLVFGPQKASPPEAGEVWCLFNDKDSVNEYRQYVRVTKAEKRDVDLSVNGRQVLTVEIGDPLEVTFKGTELHGNDALPTTVYSTIVSDAAKYYGVMKPTAAISGGDINIQVESIYTQLVPTSQAETPLIDRTPGDVGPVVKCGETRTQTFASQSWTLINLGQAFVPGSLSLTIGGTAYTDPGDGVLMQSSNQAGTIDYSLGRVTLATAKSGAVTARYDPGVGVNQIGTTLMIPVEAASRGYNYVAIMWPLPVPGTIMVDYMAEGKWYRLRDNGTGELTPDIERTGSGRIDYTTGQMTITTGALPDVGVPLLVYWGNKTEIIQLQGAVDIEIEPVHHTLADAPVRPGSLTVEWPVGISETATATDDGEGNIVGAATGWVNYGSGEMEFTPARLPLPDGEYTIRHDKYAAQTWTNPGHSGTTLTLPNAPVKPGSVSIDMTMTIGGASHVYNFRDNGQGRLGADGFSKIISQSRASLHSANSAGSVFDSQTGYAYSWMGGWNGDGYSNSGDYAQNDSENNKTLTAGGIAATIDYVTGQVVFDLTTATSVTTEITSGAGKTGSENAIHDVKTKETRIW